MNHRIRLTIFLSSILWMMVNGSPFLNGQTKIRDFCRVRGMESHFLRGVGLVTGLPGTGDAADPMTKKSLINAITRSGFSMGIKNAESALEQLVETKSACLVMVTAEIPPEGASVGDRIRVTVSTINKTSSLKGGELQETILTGGPTLGTSLQKIAGELPIFAVARGSIEMEGDTPTRGVVEQGARIEFEFRNKYYEDRTEKVIITDEDGTRTVKDRNVRYLNLILKKEFAGFEKASEIAEQINSTILRELVVNTGGSGEKYATAIGPKSIQVRFVDAYYDEPAKWAKFVTEDIDVLLNANDDVIVINERMGAISVGDGVTFEPMTFSTGEFKIDTSPFKNLFLNEAQDAGDRRMKLKVLQDALNELDAPPSKMIEIIRHLKDGGRLYGKIIYR